MDYAKKIEDIKRSIEKLESEKQFLENGLLKKEKNTKYEKMKKSFGSVFFENIVLFTRTTKKDGVVSRFNIMGTIDEILDCRIYFKHYSISFWSNPSEQNDGYSNIEVVTSYRKFITTFSQRATFKENGLYFEELNCDGYVCDYKLETITVEEAESLLKKVFDSVIEHTHSSFLGKKHKAFELLKKNTDEVKTLPTIIKEGKSGFRGFICVSY